MKGRFKLFCAVMMWLVCTAAQGGYAPQTVQDSLKRMYPKVQTVGWSTDGNYYVAGFRYKGFDTKVWFDVQGHWAMKQTDWQTMDEVPMPVYHTFTFGSYSTEQVDDVVYVQFPDRPAQVVILISPQNSLEQYELFYSMQGELINARNTTNMQNILGASTFL